MASCSPPPPPEVVVPTPAPAEAAARQAVVLYPDLGVRDSNFNRGFLERLAFYKKSNPAALTAVDWPLTLARETAEMLGVSPYSQPVARQEPPQQPTPINALDYGAYDRRSNVAKAPVFYNPYPIQSPTPYR